LDFLPQKCVTRKLTTLLKVTSDQLSALDKGDLVALPLLHHSAVFNTVDHDILLPQMRVSYEISGIALNWFLSYLTGRKHHVRYGGRCSETTLIHYGVPQGSVLGPILFIMYIADLIVLIQQHGLQPNLFADDTNIVSSCCPTSVDRHQIQTSSRHCHLIPSDHLIVGSDVIVPVESVRNL